MSGRYLGTFAALAVMSIIGGAQSASAQTIEMGGTFYYRMTDAMPGVAPCNMAYGPCSYPASGVPTYENIQRGGWHENIQRRYRPGYGR